MTIAGPPSRKRRSTLISAVVTAAASTISPATPAAAAPPDRPTIDPTTLTVPLLATNPTITVQERVSPPPTRPARPRSAATAKTASTDVDQWSRHAGSATRKRQGPHRHARHTGRTGGSTNENHRTRSLQSASLQQGRTGGTAAAAIIAAARANLGIPYVWGGESRAGFDCSGFTRYVLTKAGKRIPRTAEMQRQAAMKVDHPRPGDLVFFGSPAHHVGIYAGNGQMWHAPRSGKETRLSKIWTPNVSYGRF